MSDIPLSAASSMPSLKSDENSLYVWDHILKGNAESKAKTHGCTFGSRGIKIVSQQCLWTNLIGKFRPSGNGQEILVVRGKAVDATTTKKSDVS